VALPLEQTLPLLSTKWKSQLDPVLANTLVSGQLLTGINVVNGSNTINHGLGRKLQGYLVVMNSATSTFYDNQKSNPSPQLTLLLVASANTTVSLWVF
jgi:hypothetical protein